MIQAFKKLMLASVILMLLGYAGNLLLDNPYMHGVIRRAINHQLKDYTHLNISFAAVGAKFMPPGIEVYGIEVEDSNQKELLRASHIRASISLKALFFSRKELFNIEISEPRVQLPLPPLETLLRMEKFPELLEPSGPVLWPPQKALPFYRLAISNGQVSLRIEEAGKELVALVSSGVDTEIIFRSWNTYWVQLQTAKTNVSLDGAVILRDGKLDLKLKSVRGGLRSEVFRLDSPEINSMGALNVAFDLASPAPAGRVLKALNLRINQRFNQANLAILGRLLGTSETDGMASGKVDVQMQIPLDGNRLVWEVDGEAEAKDGRIAGFRLYDSKAEFNIREEGLRFEKITAIHQGREIIKGKGYLGFQDKMMIDFEIQPQGLPMREFMSMLQVDDFSAFEANLSPTKLKLSGQIQPFQLSIQGPVLFDQVSFPFVKDLGQDYPVGPSCQFDTQMKVTEKIFTIEKGDGHCQSAETSSSGKSPMAIHGSISFENDSGMNLSIESKQLDPSLLNHFTKLPAQGAVETHIRISGPYDNLAIAGNFDADIFSMSGFDAEAVHAEFHLPIAKNQIEVKDFTAKIGGGNLKVPLFTLAFTEALPFTLKIDAQKISSEAIAKGFSKTMGKPSLKLAIERFKGKLGGALREPFRYEGTADILIKDLAYEDESLLSELRGQFIGNKAGQELRNGFLRLETIEARLQLESGFNKAGGKASVPEFLQGLGLDERTQVRIGLHTLNKLDDQFRSNNLDPSQAKDQLGLLPYAGAKLKELNIGGLIDIDMELEGPVGRLQGKIDGSLQRPFIFGLPVSAFSFSGFLDGTKLQLPEFRHAGNSLVGRLNIDFGRPDLPYDWYIYLKQFDARAILGKFFAEDARNYAYLSAESTMTGSLRDFWKSRGDLTFVELKSKLYRNLGGRTTALELNSDQALKIDISPQRWSFEDKRPLKFHGDFFEIQISTGDNRLPDKLDLRLQGSIKLDILKSFTGLAETARGELVLDGYLRGSLSAPEYSMRIQERKLDPFNLKQWSPVALGLVNYGPALSSVSLDVEVMQDRLIVHRFRANKGREGTIDVTGTLLFAPDGKDVSLLLINLNRIEFNRLQIPVLKSADAVVSGDLTLSGNQFPFNLSGNLRVDRFQSIGSFDLRREIVSSLYETKLFNNTTGSGVAPESFVKLDVALNADRSILVKNKTIEAVLSASLRLRGTDTQPLLLGQIIADSGTFNYRRAFKITQAVVSFDEPVSPPNPRLDISGEAIINPYKVNIQVGGYLQTPKVTLASDPPTREDGTAISNLDIILLITTGKISETANKTAEKASVNEIFSSFLVFAEEPIEKLFDLSGQTVVREVYIDSYIPEENNKNTSTSKSGQQRPITRFNIPFNLFNAANAVVQVDDEANSKILFEYPLHEGITFTGSLDRKANKRPDAENNLPNDTGFDLKFRFGFD